LEPAKLNDLVRCLWDTSLLLVGVVAIVATTAASTQDAIRCHTMMRGSVRQLSKRGVAMAAQASQRRPVLPLGNAGKAGAREALVARCGGGYPPELGHELRTAH
jgi:hypothetical protein